LITGKKMADDQGEMFHDQESKKGLGWEGLVETAVDILSE